MPDEPILIPGKGEEAIASAIHYIYHAILTSYQQNPKLLKETFRKNPWHSHKFQYKFTLKLLEQLRHASTSEALLRRIIKILQTVMEAEFFASANFKNLINNIRSFTGSHNGKTIVANESKTSQEKRKNFESNGSNSQPVIATASTTNKDTGIAILLLDAENLFLDEETEEFLKKICQYEIQIKVAFANWQRMGKKDVELHNLHYELIHVPAGKDSADVKMATVGSSIFVHYPTAKEVLVCSSDEVMSHLCTTLQTHGLTVYRVRKHGKTVTVFNTQTGKTYTHILGSIPEIPTLERFLYQIKDIIKYEQAKTNYSWIKLSNVLEIYNIKYQPLAEVIAFHSPGKNISDFFLQFQNDFVLYKPEESSEYYITLFENPPRIATSAGSTLQSAFKSGIKTSINSTSELKEALIAIFKELTVKHPETPITIDALGSNFSRIYGQGITKTLSRLKQGSNFPIFLQNCGYFSLTPYGKSYLVTLHQDESKDTVNAAMPKARAFSSEIKSLVDLEVALVNILKEIIVYAPSIYIPLGVLGMEFRNRYGKPINTVIKDNLKLNSNFITVVQKLNSFKVIQTAKGWEIALAPPA
ncbi:MAG: NYN domain-containing protein [Oscillatoriaceae bacterium SKYG93]|nr:NYN domain-containing protein [Oscillatoriaceae bacterium SKYG93]MDW8455021.1 OST-HTH/LOTUS domain-containing protein [Oscillatoriaceae cyanobacterium SKYGB_i_bin93]